MLTKQKIVASFISLAAIFYVPLLPFSASGSLSLPSFLRLRVFKAAPKTAEKQLLFLSCMSAVSFSIKLHDIIA